MNGSFNPTIYKVTKIKTKSSIFSLPFAEIVDEGGFYRVAGTYIFDKYKIKKIEVLQAQIIFHMSDDDVVLTVSRK